MKNIKQIKNKLAKGQEGDWKKEGYTFKVSRLPPEQMIHVEASAPNGDWAGEYSFGDHPNGIHIYPDSAKTHIDHRRKGVASEAYRLAEHHSGRKILSIDGEQTPAAEALWANPNRPFGKSDDLEKVGVSEDYGDKPGDWETAHHDLEYDGQVSHNSHTIHKFVEHNPATENPEYVHYVKTEDGTPYSNAISSVIVGHNNDHFDNNRPYIAMRATQDGHEGKGINTALSEAALKDYGTLDSDSRVSPGTQHIWTNKFTKNPNIKVKLSQPGNIDSVHTAKWVNPKKQKILSKSDTVAIVNDLFGVTQDPNTYLREQAAADIGIPLNVLFLLAKDKSFKVRNAALNNSHVNQTIFHQMFQKAEPHQYREYARHSFADSDVIGWAVDHMPEDHIRTIQFDGFPLYINSEAAKKVMATLVSNQDQINDKAILKAVSLSTFHPEVVKIALDKVTPEIATQIMQAHIDHASNGDHIGLTAVKNYADFISRYPQMLNMIDTILAHSSNSRMGLVLHQGVYEIFSKHPDENVRSWTEMATLPGSTAHTDLTKSTEKTNKLLKSLARIKELAAIVKQGS